MKNTQNLVSQLFPFSQGQSDLKGVICKQQKGIPDISVA